MKGILKGGLVDKKEQFIFEAYKKKVLKTCKEFKREIKETFGFEPSTDLYTMLTNYQIKRYGSTLEGSNVVELEPRFSQNKRERRKGREERVAINKATDRFIERVEK